jgi:hypothetical protein
MTGDLKGIARRASMLSRDIERLLGDLENLLWVDEYDSDKRSDCAFTSAKCEASLKKVEATRRVAESMTEAIDCWRWFLTSDEDEDSDESESESASTAPSP